MAVLTAEGRREPMEDDDEELSSSSPTRQCRICHEEEEERCAAMASPCTCSGSLKYAHRGCVQRWCDEKGSTLCEICLQNFEPGYTIPPKKAPVVEMQVTVIVSEDEDDDDEVLLEHRGTEPGADCSWCRSLTTTFTIMLLVWHLVAVASSSEHCAFSAVVVVYLLRAAGILLPFHALMRLIRVLQHRCYRITEEEGTHQI